MTSKSLEALERLGSEKLARGEFIRNDSKVEPYIDTIKQDLERKETLEEIHKDDTQRIKKLEHELSIYKTKYYELDEAIAELIVKLMDKFRKTRSY